MTVQKALFNGISTSPNPKRERRRKYKREWQRQWNAKHPEKVREMNRRSRAKLLAKNPHYDRDRKRGSWQRFKAQQPERYAVLRQKARLKAYNLTIAEYKALYESQEGKCAVCLTELADRRGARNAKHIDHDHNTGRVRGLLCHNCNMLLGHAKESSEILGRAIVYLQSNISSKADST